MAEPKTKPTNASVADFINAVEPEWKRADSWAIVKMMEEITGEPPQMWGDSIVGFGTYTYKYKSGQQGDWPRTGFSPRKQSLTIYIMAGFDGYGDLLAKLGKFKTSKACLYVNKLEDIDTDVLRKLIKGSAEYMDKIYPQKKQG